MEEKLKELMQELGNAINESLFEIWHVGRVSHPSFLNGELPISASETIMNGRVKRSDSLLHGKSRGHFK